MSDQLQRKQIFTEEVFNQAVAVLSSCLKATKPVKDGRNNYRDEPDWKLRKEAALAIIEQETGKATSKSELTVSGGNGGQTALTQADLMEQARKDPEMAARIAAGYVEGLKSAEAAE